MCVRRIWVASRFNQTAHSSLRLPNRSFQLRAAFSSLTRHAQPGGWWQLFAREMQLSPSFALVADLAAFVRHRRRSDRRCRRERRRFQRCAWSVGGALANASTINRPINFNMKSPWTDPRSRRRPGGLKWPTSANTRQAAIATQWCRRAPCDRQCHGVRDARHAGYPLPSELGWVPRSRRTSEQRVNAPREQHSAVSSISARSQLGRELEDTACSPTITAALHRSACLKMPSIAGAWKLSARPTWFHAGGSAHLRSSRRGGSAVAPPSVAGSGR